MTTVNDWVEETREHLGGGIVEQVNRLAQDYQPGDPELVFQYELKGITIGVPMSIDMNCFQVWSVTESTKTVEVTARWAGAPDVAMSAGEIARVKPNFFTHRIVTAINNTLSELTSPLMGVHGVAIQDISFDQSVTVYDLTDCEEIERILRVQVGVADDDTDPWIDLDENAWQYRKLEPTADFPSGHQLRIFDAVGAYDRFRYAQIPNTIRIIYARRLPPVDTLDDDVSNTYLPESAYDLPVLGAASRLALPQEFRRNLLSAQPDSRRANEVQPGASLGGARALRQLFMDRVEQEAARLLRDYPPKRR